jgi:hypothetical protein
VKKRSNRKGRTGFERTCVKSDEPARKLSHHEHQERREKSNHLKRTGEKHIPFKNHGEEDERKKERSVKTKKSTYK